MGYQESFIKFKDVNTLKAELQKYNKRVNKDDDLASVYCVDRVTKAVSPFKKGELVMVIGGERSEQRSGGCLKEGLGIENVKDIVFIDNPQYYSLSNGDLSGFLDEHFEKITEEEYQELLN